ncbi:MFS transporter [Streptomyces triticirhizae]|uniref:MFS transporter n=1 Tax=Streptomyces triticirhizae TaxID=2483353 RepID=A0A3M2LEJ0_9ACTN|nr:MFS transporter [Streptomyces triticirhizae]
MNRRAAPDEGAPGPGPRGALSGAQRALLVGGFLVNTGTFAVYPYLAVLLRERLGVGMATVGVVLGLATLTQFASAPFTAAFAERVGLRRALVLATFLYALGAASYLAGVRLAALTVVALFLSCGAGALYSPAYRSYLVRTAGPEERPRLVSLGNAAGNLGIAAGPVVGALFLHAPNTLFTATTVLYAALAAGHLRLRNEGQGGGADVEPFRRVLHGLAWVPFAVTVVTHYLYMQFYQYLSVFAAGRLPTAGYGVIMMGYSLGLAVLQPLLARWVGAVRHGVAMAVGFGCMAAGLAAIATGRPVGVAAGAAAMSVGTAVLFLKNDLEAIALSARSVTVTFGQQRLAVGLGALLSGVVGGAAYGFFERAGALPAFWLAAAAQCLVLPPLALLAGRRLAARAAAARADDAGRQSAGFS